MPADAANKQVTLDHPQHCKEGGSARIEMGPLTVRDVSNSWNATATLGLDRFQLYWSGSPTPLRTIAGPDTGMNWPSFVVLAP